MARLTERSAASGAPAKYWAMAWEARLSAPFGLSARAFSP
jgi:hypothetical protein